MATSDGKESGKAPKRVSVTGWSPTTNQCVPADRPKSFFSNLLKGDQLTIQSIDHRVTETLNLSKQAAVSLIQSEFTAGVVNVFGTDTLDATLPNGTMVDTLTVKLAAGATLTGSFNLGTRADLVISGGAGSELVHTADDTLSAPSYATIDTKVVGAGTFTLTWANYRGEALEGSMEFGGYVGVDQKIDITGHLPIGGYQTPPSQVTIDDPGQFLAAISLHDYSLADFKILVAASSWSYKNDLLSITNAAGSVIDTFHIVSAAAAPSTGSIAGLSVTKSAAGDVLVSPGTDLQGTFASMTS